MASLAEVERFIFRETVARQTDTVALRDFHGVLNVAWLDTSERLRSLETVTCRQCHETVLRKNVHFKVNDHGYNWHCLDCCDCEEANDETPKST